MARTQKLQSSPNQSTAQTVARPLLQRRAPTAARNAVKLLPSCGSSEAFLPAALFLETRSAKLRLAKCCGIYSAAAIQGGCCLCQRRQNSGFLKGTAAFARFARHPQRLWITSQRRATARSICDRYAMPAKPQDPMGIHLYLKVRLRSNS